MEYLGSMIDSIFSTVFIAFLIAAIGYMIGAIEIKGISLGTAGVLLTALIYGIIASFVPSLTIGQAEIVLFDNTVKTSFGLISSLGTAMFVTSVGLIAGPKFFRTFNRSCMAYIYMGLITIVIGTLVTVALILLDSNLEPEMAVGLMTGALTSTPGLSAAKEIAAEQADLVTAGYGIAYLFGVLGVVLFVQLVPRMLKVDIAEERNRFVAANTVAIPAPKGALKKIEEFGFLPFALAIAAGCMIGAVTIPGIDFSLGNSGGCLLAGLLIGHFAHIGRIDLRIDKVTLKFFRELGLVLFLIGAGVPGGVNFISSVKVSYFIYGALITLIPMVGGYFVAKYIFKLDLFNTLGSITGGMTSTPALGSLIATAGTEEVAAAYAATYPVALVFVVIAAKVIVML